MWTILSTDPDDVSEGLRIVRPQSLPLHQSRLVHRLQQVVQRLYVVLSKVKGVAGEAGINAPLERRLVFSDIVGLECDPVPRVCTITIGVLERYVKLRNAVKVGPVRPGLPTVQLIMGVKTGSASTKGGGRTNLLGKTQRPCREGTGGTRCLVGPIQGQVGDALPGEIIN